MLFSFMIYKIKISCTFVFFFIGLNLFGQREFNMSSNGFGYSEENAIQNAIIGSLNQVFGMFYSSNTLISKDSLTMDDFAKVNRGNIMELKIISTEEISLNKWFVNINLTISLDDIEKYYQSIGETLKYDGSLFSFNIQIQELNELNETKSICNMIEIANDIALTLFDYSLTNSDPISIDELNEKWLVNFKVNASINQNVITFRNVLLKTLKGLSLTQSEIENYSLLGKQTYLISILEDGKAKDYYVRSPYSFNIIENFINSWEGYVRSFDIVCGPKIKIVRGNLIKKETSNRTNKNVERVNFAHEIDIKKLILEETATSILFRLPDTLIYAGVFDWFEYFTILDLEKIDGYKIESNKLLKYKNGGFIISEKDGHGIVLSPFELSIKEFKSNKNILIGAYSDWIVPSYEDFISINKNIYLNYYCNFNENEDYLTSTQGELSVVSVTFHMYKMISDNQTAFITRVRLIRKF